MKQMVLGMTEVVLTGSEGLLIFINLKGIQQVFDKSSK